MSWTAPMTAVAHTVFTSSDFNVNIRDNLLCEAPAIAANPTSYFVVDDLHSIVERQFVQNTVLTSESTASDAWADLATEGPAVTVTTNEYALVLISCEISNDTLGASSYAGVNVFGPGMRTHSPTDYTGIYVTGKPANMPEQGMASIYFRTLTPGLNTFKMQYRRLSVGNAVFSKRTIMVMPL